MGDAPPPGPAGAPAWLSASRRFSFRRALGAGASGVVVEAFDSRRGEALALKALAPPASPAERAALEAHFRALAALDHPNLVSPRELVDEAGALVLTMPVVEGVSLSALLLEPNVASTHLLFGQPSLDAASARAAAARRRPSLPLRRALADVAAGLDALHRAGLCHGDVRPDNALVLRDGGAKLIDFGPWTPAEASSAWRERPPAYLPPEQTPDAPWGPDADRYAFGVLLFEALTGHLPFAGSALDVTLRKTTLPPPHPSFLARNVEPALDALAFALLSRDPADRPSAVEALGLLSSPPA